MASGGKVHDIGQVEMTDQLGASATTTRKDDGLDKECQKLLDLVFLPPREEEELSGEACRGAAHSSSDEKRLSFHTVDGFIQSSLDAVDEETEAKEAGVDVGDDEEEESKPTPSVVSNGRLGPDTVLFDISTNVGTLVIEPDRLGISSHSNFSTIKANCCVFKGKWVYELMLGSKGVMQLGWCTVNCKFSQEEGVGDTPDSYAYDGNRLRKWNVRTVKYGEAWLTGDVISCAIDCDEGTVTFCRNGKSMGTAFSNLRLGPGLAYFPVVSLSFGETLRANFGATPLRYPLEGYSPLESPPSRDLLKAQILFNYLDRLLPTLVEEPEESFLSVAGVQDSCLPQPLLEKRSTKASAMLIAAHIFDKLAPFMKSAYIVEACLMNFLQKHCDHQNSLAHQPIVQKTLDLLWAFQQEFELKPCLESLVVSLLSSYRFSPVTPDFTFQQMYLSLTLAILRHEASRKYLLKHVLFDKVKFPIFLHVKPPDDAGLSEIIPEVWWEYTKKDGKSEPEHLTEEQQQMKQQYLKSCDALKQKVEGLENIQVEILKVLLINKDHSKGASTRFIFLHKFREFLKENTQTARSHMVNQCPLPVSLCFFHRLIQALRYYWDEYASEHLGIAESKDAFVTSKNFYDDSINYFDMQRLGGLLSHLKKTYKAEIAKSAGQTSEAGRGDTETVTYDKITGLRLTALSPRKKTPEKEKSHDQSPDQSQDGEPVIANSLIEILDGIVLLYHIAAHKQLGKMCTLRDTVNEYVGALQDTEKKIATCPPEMTEVMDELQRAYSVFTEKASEQARHMAWVIGVIYAKSKQDDVAWLLHVVMATIENASTERRLFQFCPEFYINVCINSCLALKTYFHPTMPFSNIAGFQDMMHRFALFLSNHFADPRIVSTDVEDTIVQALACFVCYPPSLKAFESIPIDNRYSVVKSLIAPYENRSWAQTNWILVRLWKGCGFGFRYTHLPHLLPAKNQQQDLGNASLQKPNPSIIYQSHIAETLLADWEVATKLFDSLLNQLNWAFSEFVGKLQELQQLTARSHTTFIDSRQLKICATCFDISVGLLRVIEMIITLTPQLVLDWSKPSAELLLARLYQLLCQILNRVTQKANLFENVVSLGMPGLDTVDHFPVLTAVAGILVQVIVKGDEQSVECATAALLAEPGFQLSSLEFLLGGNGQQGGAAAAAVEKKQFTFRKFVPEELCTDEIEQIEKLITHMRIQQNRMRVQTPETREEDLCSICYAHAISAIFKPCGHQSCKACIQHHLMSKKECFFCMTVIDHVEDLSGKHLRL